MKNNDTNFKSPESGENSGMKRRSFVKLLGGGIFFFFQPWNALDLLALPQQQQLVKAG